jgi:hypothetical protein
MLNEPHDLRLHTRRATHGSYNSKDPPGSPTLKYPGPQWVPDSLRAAWCAAETLTRCLPHGTPVTYESTRRMLDCVLPDQRDRCEIGIELMLIDGHFTLEQAFCARSYTDSSPLAPESVGLRKSLRRGSSCAPRLQDDTLDKILISHKEMMAEHVKWRDGLKPMPCHSDPASETVLQVKKAAQTSNAARKKVSKPETQTQLERAQETRPYAGSSSTELVKPPERHRGWEISPLLSSKSDTSTVVREQSHKTVLVREPPKGSSLVDSKSSRRMVSESSSKSGRARPADANSMLPNPREVTHSRPSPPQSTPPVRNYSRATLAVVKNVSTAETRNSLERVGMTRSAVSPSSSMPDYPSVSSRLMMSLPRNAREPLTIGPRPAKSSPKMMSPISRPSSVPSLSVRAKAREQSVRTVLNRELPNGSPLNVKTPTSGVISALLSSKLRESSVPAKRSADKVDVGFRKVPSITRRSPLPNAAPMLRKSTPVSSLRAPAARSSEDGATLSFPTNSIRHTLETVSTRRVVRVTAHREPETPPQLSREAAPPRSVGPAIEQALVFSSSKEGEERRVYDTVVSIQRKSEGPHSPSSETARKQSNPSEVTEGKWLARAAMYIRERMNARSSVCDEFVRCTLKGPPDKSRASEDTKEVRRCDVDVVNEESKASVSPRSPGTCPESSKLSRSPPEAAILQCSSLSLHSCKKTRFTVTSLSPVMSVKREIFAPFLSSRSARFSQTFPSPSQPSSGLSGPFPKSSDDEDYKPQPLKVVSLTHASSVEQHSPEIEGSAPYPVLRPGITQTSLSRLPSLEEWWRARCKPPDVMAEPEQRNNSLVSNNGGSSATKRSPLTEAVYTPPIPPSARSLRMCNPRHTSPELVWRVLQPPDWAAIRRSLNRVVSKFEPRRRNSHSLLGSVRFASSVHVFSCLHTALEISH